MSKSLIWKDPPPKTRESKHAETIAALKTRRGTWAMVQSGLTPGTANSLATSPRSSARKRCRGATVKDTTCTRVGRKPRLECSPVPPKREYDNERERGE